MRKICSLEPYKVIIPHHLIDLHSKIQWFSETGITIPILRWGNWGSYKMKWLVWSHGGCKCKNQTLAPMLVFFLGITMQFNKHLSVHCAQNTEKNKWYRIYEELPYIPQHLRRLSLNSRIFWKTSTKGNLVYLIHHIMSSA